MQTIYSLNAEDADLIARYNEIDGAIGEAFADENCTQLVENWRQIALARIATIGGAYRSGKG